MGDRNNPIKFGPEWLRNLAREHRSEGNNATAPGPSGNGGAAGATGGQPNSSSTRMTHHSVSNMASKVLLAKLRYGREEMLALYESTADAPPELQHIDALYQARPKPPLALNNTFEDEMRDARNVPLTGSMSSNDRFTAGRGVNRVIIHADGRGKPRGSNVRQMSAGRGSTGGWHPINARLPTTFALGPDEELNITRPWNNNSQHPIPNRNNTEQPDWTNKVFRSKRTGHHTNWRQQHSREDGEEWRAEPGRSRPQPDKWERDWGDRSNQGERQPWTSNRRSWVSGDPHNNDDLPEWAVENAEACGGTFDSSGAFHGYSNDDSNLPKNQEVYPLTRSHTHGSFGRQKAAEDGLDDWWSSEKAKKLSPKRFDASDIKFKKPSTRIPEKVGPTNSKVATPRDEPLQEIPEKLQAEKCEATPEQQGAEGNNSAHDNDKFNKNNTYKQQFSESKTFDALMRSDINIEEASDERGNFQSVMIAPNNSLRQKHQNMVPAVCEGPKRLSRHEILQMMQANSVHQHNMEMDMMQNPQKTTEESILEEMMDMKLDDKEMMPKMSMVGNQQMMNNSNQSGSGMPPGSGMASAGNNVSQMQNMPMQQMRLPSPGLTGNHNQAMVMNSHPNMNMAPGMQGMGMQSIGITNSALNASLGLSVGPNMNMPMQGVPPPAMTNNMGPAGMQPGLHQGGRGRMPTYPMGVVMPGMPGANMGNRSLFLRQNPVNNIQLPSDIPMPNHRAQSNMFPNHGLQHPGNQPQMYGNSMYGNSMYGNMMHQSNSTVSPGPQNLAEQWYYEDPKKTIQGPFSSKEMYNWYRAGFFSPTLMVRRACEVGMRPLGSYGPLVPFAQMDMMPLFPMSVGYEPRPQQHENMLPPQQGLGGMDVMNIGNMNMSENSAMDCTQLGSVGLMRNPPFPQPPPMMDSLWGQPSTPTELLWMQQAMQDSRTDARVNNLAMYLWDQQPNTNSNSTIPEDIVKEMKTEDQILAQLRAQSIGTPQNIDPPQNINTPPNLSFFAEPPTAPAASQVPKPDDSYLTNMSVTPNLEELEKLLQKQSLVTTATPEVAEPIPAPGLQAKPEKPIKTEQPPPEPVSAKPQNAQNKVAAETKAKSKTEVEKASKKENSTSKPKTKKAKEEKKEDVAEVKTKDDKVVKVEKKVEEEEKRASSKSKKEEKANVKKEMDKEKKEWIKDGFTIVKGAEKNTNKESKKKADEAKAAEETERKRKEEEKLAVEEEKKKKQADVTKKQQEQQQQRQISESVIKKAPWSAVTTQAMQTATKEPTLAEIQRLEREKKLEQMKEQQQMMQIIAQQQAAALAREQEMQAGLGWAKKMGNNVISPSQSLAEIQAEARKQSAAAAVAAAAVAALVQEEAEIAAPPPTNHVPWASTHNGGGFWDTQPNQPSKPEKVPEPPKTVEPVKTKKKLPNVITKKEVTPAAEFETWCTTVLASYSAKIDVPTFIGFLRDTESPYDVKDYVKCYLGDTKDSNDFARQFLERRSKMIRVGMVTPSDDLCSPAIAVNPRTVSGSDYQEVKGKGKKTKKNKMMKIDARILGFSVTASEDRINVGDIDSV